MRITIIADVLGESNNGTSVTANRLIDSLRRRGHEVKVVATSYEGNAEFHKVGKRSIPFLNRYISKNGVSLAKPDREVLDKVIKESDVVHVMMPFKLGQSAARIANRLNVPCTGAFHVQPENFTAHLKLRDFKPINDMLYGRFRRVLYRRVTDIHCPSRFVERELLKHGYTSRLHVISNGVPDSFVPAPAMKPEAYRDRFCILCIARLSGEKRHDLLVKAVKYSKYADKIQLIFAGEGPRRKKLTHMGRSLAHKVDMGHRTQDELYEIINYCDLYAHPSDNEIESIGCLEAFSCGLVPVISDSKKSATNQFALDENCLFKKGDARDLARRIDFFIENPEYKAELSKRYVCSSDQYKIEKCIDKMEKMFVNVTAQTRQFGADTCGE